MPDNQPERPNPRKTPNYAAQQPKPPGPDTLFFEACIGRTIRCVVRNNELDCIEGTLTAYDKYGMVIDTDVSEWKHGLVYVFKASLAYFFPIDNK